MKVTEVNGCKVREYNSIGEFEKFINETPFNEVFRWAKHDSVDSSTSWSGTQNYEEANDLMKHGAEDLSKKIEKMYQVKTAEMASMITKRAKYDVTGFQVSIPRRLQGIPDSMINQKTTTQKQKIITLNKDVSYSSYFTKEQIIDESAKALAIVKKFESQGYRVNINIVFLVESEGQKVGCKIRVKNASERMNISKLAFLIAHPSMLRRILLRWEEVNPDITKKGFTYSYGSPLDIYKIQAKNELTIPKVIGNIETVADQMQVKMTK